MSTGLLQSAQNLIAGLLDLGRTRFELFGTELREEMARLANRLLGGLAVLVLGALGIGFAAAAVVLAFSPENRLAASAGVAAFFFVAAGLVAWWIRRVAAERPRAFDATLSELQRDITAIKP